jgi:hypothetical protein
MMMMVMVIDVNEYIGDNQHDFTGSQSQALKSADD